MKLLKCAKTVLRISIFCASIFEASANMDCRSMLGAYITPLWDSSNVVGGIELTGAIAGMTDRNIKNGLVIAGLGYVFNDSKQQFYVEGGYKNFHNSKGGPGRQNADTSIGGYESFAKVDKKHWGLREAFYRYNAEDLKLTVGLQTMKLPDYFLLDERVIGVNSAYSSGNFTYSFTAATVMAEFARYADFCGTRHIYNLTRGGRVDFLGEDFGESNFLTASVKWVNNPEVAPAKESSNNEDEFEEFIPIASANSKPFVQEVGAIVYEEFGDVFPDYKYYGGAFAKFNLPLDIGFKTEVLYQHVYKEKSIGYYLELNRSFDWSEGYNTLLGAAMLGKSEIDDNTMFYPSYTNLFIGEVMKMDALDLPVAQFYLKQNLDLLPSMHFKVQYAKQLEESKTQELDLELSAKFFKHLKISTIGGIITSDELKQDTYFGRIEFRLAL